MSQGRHRVVIVGGFGGVRVTRALARTDVEVTLVDRTNHHLFQPLLYQVATGILPDGLIAPALRNVIKNQKNARALLAEGSYSAVALTSAARSAPPRARDGRRVDGHPSADGPGVTSGGAVRVVAGGAGVR